MEKLIKKTLIHPRADEIKRVNFQIRIAYYKIRDKIIVYVDESGFAHDMPRTHGYSTKGKRCYGELDWHAKGRVNAIGAIIGKKLLTICLFEFNIDSDIFYTWLTKDLIPKLPKKSVIVMDNATFHKRKDMIQAIEDKEHILEYLPPYSPDFNPIEKKWAQVKAIRRQDRCSSYDLFSCTKYYDKLY